MIKKFALKAFITGMLAVAGWTSVAALAPSAVSAATQESLDLLETGKGYIGTPYQYGSTAFKTDTFDCSSFVQYVFDQNGISLPRTSASQAYMGQKIDKAYLSVGDLLFFKTGDAWIGHVGIYAGDGMMIHASGSKGVAITSMKTDYWTDAFVMARRIL